MPRSVPPTPNCLELVPGPVRSQIFFVAEGPEPPSPPSPPAPLVADVEIVALAPELVALVTATEPPALPPVPSGSDDSSHAARTSNPTHTDGPRCIDGHDRQGAALVIPT